MLNTPATGALILSLLVFILVCGGILIGPVIEEWWRKTRDARNNNNIKGGDTRETTQSAREIH